MFFISLGCNLIFFIDNMFGYHLLFQCKWEKGSTWVRNIQKLIIIPYLPKCKTILIKDDLKKIHICERKVCLSKYKMTPKNKIKNKEKYFTINFIHLIHKVHEILSTFTNQCHFLHVHSQCLHLPHTNSYCSHPPDHHSTTYHHQSHPVHWIYSNS